MLQMNPPTERVSISKIFYDIEKKSEKFHVQMKKRKFLDANNSEYRDKFNITPLGWGCSQPTIHDKNNELSSEIPPLGHYI